MRKIVMTVVAATLAIGAFPASAGAASSYTAKDVAKHASAKSCWSSINGNVYDLTTWVKRHPGGSRLILAICGKDGSRAFNGEHAGDGKPASQLAPFKIGTLRK